MTKLPYSMYNIFAERRTALSWCAGTQEKDLVRTLLSEPLNEVSTVDTVEVPG